MTRQSSLTYISLEAIQPSPYQPRKYFKEQDLLDLAKSIHKIGLLHPPVVRLLKTGCYELVSGERRLRAAKLAGLQEIPVILREMDTEISAEACLIENIQRVDLSASEVARGLHKLIQTFA